ncbi:MAG: hypothetical protein G8237_07910 [Magnetococcales bacterium]|nr:hypothetical protein [Magnetococcales bacterium]NGZ06267.1 hypothetical protein [Magnetococcales bacterium]
MPGIWISRFHSRSWQGHYWALQQHLARAARLWDRPDFARLAWRDQWRFWTRGVQPVDGACRQRAHAAAEWLIRAWKSTPDDGVSMGYFPCDPPERSPLGNGWRPSYPETTGYIMVSLLDYALRFSDALMRERVLAMAHWEARIQMASGAVQGGAVTTPEHQRPAVFNTGMVLHGFAALLTHEPDPVLEQAARRAADFLLTDMDDEGHLRTHGAFVTAQPIKTYNCLCAWGLYRFGALVQENRYQEAALRLARAAMRLQQTNGWFPHNCLSREEAPLTHTIGYTLQGLLETGIAAGDENLIAAAHKGMQPILALISPEGFLPGRLHADWSPAAGSSCLTGNAQLAVVCYRLYQVLRDRTFLEAGHRLVDFLKGLQVMESLDSPMRGALPGSFPLFFGEYQPAGFPNWATKYLLDALLLQDRLIEERA